MIYAPGGLQLDGCETGNFIAKVVVDSSVTFRQSLDSCIFSISCDAIGDPISHSQTGRSGQYLLAFFSGPENHRYSFSTGRFIHGVKVGGTVRRRSIIHGDFRCSSLCTYGACEPEGRANISLNAPLLLRYFHRCASASHQRQRRSGFISALCRSEKPQLRSWRALAAAAHSRRRLALQPVQTPAEGSAPLPSNGCHLAVRRKRRTLKS